MDTKYSMHVLVDLNLATSVARPAVVYLYACAAQLRGVARGNLSKNSFLTKKHIFLKKGAVIDTTKTRSLFGPPRSLFGIKKREPLLWAIFWLPKVAEGRPLFSTKRNVPFCPRPYFSTLAKMRVETRSAETGGIIIT